MEFKVTLKNLRISARKVRLVTDAVRGRSVSQALAILQELDKKSAVPVSKLIKSAVANAAHTENILESQLRVDQIFVGEGPTLKRFRPRAMGRAFMIRKRTSHVTVVLSLIEESAKRSTKKAEVTKTEEVKGTKTKKSTEKKTTSAKKTTKKESSTKTSSRTTKSTSSKKVAAKKPVAKKKSTKKTEE